MAILMIRPTRFGYNAQTAVNNAFQTPGTLLSNDVQQKAVEEFDRFVLRLRSHGVDVLVVQDTGEPHTPDSIFPNNWISFHEDGTAVLYPMFAENRRLERKHGVIEAVSRQFAIRRWVDYSVHESEGKFLEGTGSFVLDRVHKIAYACRSARTDESLFRTFCMQMGYQPIIFNAQDDRGQVIYHTNVMLCVADRYAVICMDSVAEPDRGSVRDALESSGKTIVSITQRQLDSFAGNMLQVANTDGKTFLVMSSQALRSLDEHQVLLLESFDPIIHTPLDTIEQLGGGSARCMMAEVLLPVNSSDQQQ